ncbi:MAG: c-type cytochrome biogenesis protein CcsB [Vulcanimicrobiaceae bacterium]
MHTKMTLDAVLMVIALASYAVAALALLAYFFSREDWLRNLGASLAIAGCISQFVQFVARYELTGIWPFLNLYGSISLFTAMSVAIYLYFAFRYKIWFAGGFLLLIAAVFLAYGITWNEGAMPAVPSLQSYWAKIHVPIVVASYAAFLVSFVLSCVYLLKYYSERYFAGPFAKASVSGTGVAAMSMPGGPVHPTTIDQDEANPKLRVLGQTPAIAAAAAQGNAVALWLEGLPTLPQLDILVYRAVAIGLPLLTLGIITGAMWAHEAWGAYWQWDPKETAALFSWIVYASYLHLHTRGQWRGLRVNWVSVIGFASIIFCYLGVNIWISGLHSYAR